MNVPSDEQMLFSVSAAALDDWRISTTADLAEIKAMMRSLIGNGHPGRITVLESRVSSLEVAKNRFAGALGVIAAAGGYVARLVMQGKL